ncbi:MAG: PaRep2b protein, partial [Pyrobaculum sp.]
VVLNREAAFKAKDFVVAKVKAQLEKVAVKEPEFAHILAEVAEDVLSSFGRLMASPNAARHVHEALFYHFEGYQTRDGEVLFARIERTVREAVRRAEEAGIPDAEYRIKQFVLEVIDILARAGERYRRDALKGLSTVEKALRTSAFAGLSATALYSAYSGLYSEAVVSSVASAVALVEVGRFREAVEYVQRAAKALYEAAKEVFEHVKITVQRLVELFVEAVTRVLAWVDEHKANLFLMAAVAAGAIALSTALNLWGLVELEKLAYAASLTPFVPAGVKEYSRQEVFNILKNEPDPYEKFREIANDANVGRVKLAEPWESLKMLIMPKSSEERELMRGRGAGLYSKYRKDENYRRALFYAVFALEETFGVYRTALGEYAKGLREVVQRVEVGEEPFKKVVYVADLKQIKRLAKEEEATFEKALSTLRKRLNEYAFRYGLRDLLDVKEDVARRLAEAKTPELPEFKDVGFGVKAYAALIAYREYALGRRSAFGTAAKHWLEVGRSARLLYYAPYTAYLKAERAKVERPAEVGEMAAEGLRRLFLRPGADHYGRLFEELTKSGKLALMLEKAKSAYVFRLFRVEEGDGLKELGVRLKIEKVEEGEKVGITYTLISDVERWLGFFGQEIQAGVKAAEEVGERLPVEDRFPYMAGWVASDVAITRNKEGERGLEMGTTHLWQLAETHALFGWPYISVLGVGLTLEGPKPQFRARASLGKLDEVIRRSVEGGWLRMLGTKAGLEDLMYVKSWDDLKRWVAKNWDIVVDAAVKPLGGNVRSELEALRDRLNDDKVAREVVAPALLLIQAERLGVNEETLRYLGAVISGAIGGDGYVSAALGKVVLTSGEREIALLWAATLAAYGIETEVRNPGRWFNVVASGDDAVKLARLYFFYGSPLLEGDERIINHKLAEAVELGAEGLNISWEGLRRTEGGLVAADLTISVGGAAVKYNVYLRDDVIKLQFQSTDRSRVELAVRILRLAGVSAEVQRESGRDVWYVLVYTDKLAAGRKELRDALAKIVETARGNGWVDEKKAELWLEKLESGIALKEGWPKYKMGVVDGALVVRFGSTSPDSIKREAQRLRDMGLEEGKHFTVKMPEGDHDGYVYIRREGLERAAWLSVYGSGRQQELAAEFVKYILQRAEKEGDDVYEKAKEIVKEGKERGSLTLKGFEKEVKVEGKKHVVKVIDGSAEFDVGRGGRKLLRIRIIAEVGGVRRDYTITYGRYGKINAAIGYATVRADPDGRVADAERLSVLVEALTGRRPRVYRMKDGRIRIECYEGHLEGFRRFAELADAIERWLEETGRR